MVKLSMCGSTWRDQYGRHSVVTGRSATSMPFKMRQYRWCSVSKTHVLWHDSKTMVSTTPPWCKVLNPNVEEPGDPLGNSLQLGDAPVGGTQRRTNTGWRAATASHSSSPASGVMPSKNMPVSNFHFRR